MLGAVAIAAVGLLAAFAANAYATPSKTSNCGGCHTGAVLGVTASEMSNDGTTANYTVSAPGADVVAVFDGATKINQVTGVSGTISVPVGKTYVLQAVAGPGEADGWGSTSISPVAAIIVPTPDPTTTPTPDPTPTVDPTETVPPTVDPTETVPPTVDPTETVDPDPIEDPAHDVKHAASVRIHVMADHGHGIAGMTVTLTNTLTGAAVTGVTDDHGSAKFGDLTKGTYTASVTLADGTVLTKTFKVGDHNHKTVALKDHKAKADHKHDTHKAAAHKTSDHKSDKVAKADTKHHAQAKRH
jgi:hypothetical protein